MVSIQRKDLNILDIGCGSGWLSVELARFGKVTAVDLAIEKIHQLQKKHPHIEWIGGDFLSLDIRQNHYHLVISLETIAHVSDQEAFALRIAEVMHPKGKFLLTTQNEYVWSRTKSLRPPGKGQIRNWPSRQKLIGLFEPYFKINNILTCAPGGDRGLPGLFNSRIISAIMRDFWDTKSGFRYASPGAGVAAYL